jgi:hypothetical protein
VKNTTFTFNGKVVRVNMLTTDREIDVMISKLRKQEALRQEAQRREESRYVNTYVSRLNK